MMLRLYHEGAFDSDRMVTATYAIDQIAEGYRDLHAAKIIRGVILSTNHLPCSGIEIARSVSVK
jgi:Zn-dependent alcohol dehydrogenase